MPRKARLDLPGVTVHVTQRGVNRCAIFLDDLDRQHYRRLLHEECIERGIALHAFVLMDNHVHLLMTPAALGALSGGMRMLGQNYVQAFNARHGRSGTLWQGRFKSCLVQTRRYLLTVMRYIELNPLRAAMVGAPEAYAWSSVHAHLGMACDPTLTPHPAFLALGADAAARGQVWREWLMAGVGQADLAAIRQHLAQERAYGSPRFQRMVERALGRPVVCRGRGRPLKGDGGN